MPGPDLSQFGDDAPPSVDLSSFGSDQPNAALAAPHHGLFDGLAGVLGQIYGPGNRALAQSVPGQAAFARSLVAGVPGMAGKVVQGLGSAVDAADRLMMSPAEREAFDYGQRAIGPAPTFSRTVAPVARAATSLRNAVAPAVQSRGDQLGESIGGMAGLVGAAVASPVLGIGAFGASGAQDVQDDAARLGVAGTPRADVAVLGNAGVQSALGALAPQAIAGRAIPQLGKTYVGRLLSSAGGNAILGAAMPAAENAIVGATYDPRRPLTQGVPESAAQMALLGGLMHVGGTHGEAPSSAPGAHPDLSTFGAPANDLAPAPEIPTTAPQGRLEPIAGVAPDDFPGDWAPSPPPPQAAATSAPAVDPLTAQALDVLRSGSRVRVDHGPSLVDYLSRNGGLADTGGDLAALGGQDWHKDQAFRSRLIRPSGRSLDDAAQAAHEAGYFPEVAPPQMEGGGNMQAVSPDALISAIGDEFAGRPRYARRDEVNSDLAQHVEDLDQITNELGIDPKAMSNEQIQSAIDGHFRQPDRRMGMRTGPLQGSVFDALRESIAADAAKADAASPSGLTADNGALSGASADPLAARQGDSRVTTERKLNDLLTDSARRSAGADAIAGRAPGPNADGARYLADEVLRERNPHLEPKIAAGELDVQSRHMGPGGKADFVQTGSLADHMDEPGTLYHGTSAKNAESILNRVFSGPRRHDGLYVSPDRDLALGQGGRGVLLEFDPRFVNGSRPQSVQNQTLGAIGNGTAEFKIDKTLKQAVRAISTSTAAQMEKLRSLPWLASRFDFDNAERVGNGYRIERNPPAPQRLGMGSRAGDEAARNARDERLAARFSDRRAVDLSAYGEAVRAAGHVSTGLRAAPRPGAVAAADPANIGHLDHTVSTLAEQLRRTLDLTHRQGRLTLRGGAVGEFDPKTGVIRTKSVHEMDVLAHEAFHALDSRKFPQLDGALKAHQVELKTLAYPGAPANALREEGFAEFGRWYLTNPQHALRVAPGFYPAFETALRQDAPKMLSELQAIQSAYGDLLRAPSAAVARSLVVAAVKSSPLKTAVADVRQFGVRGAVEKWSNELYRRGIDDLHPVSLAVRDLLKTYEANTGRKLDLAAAKNPYALARLSRGAYAKGHMDVMHGVTPYRGTQPEGPSVPDALHKAFGRKGWNESSYHDFGAYLVSRRLVHEWARYEKGELGRPPDKFTRETHEQAIKDFEAAHPTWRDAAQMIYAWNANLWKLERDAGFISNSLYEQGAREHPDYVPLQRDMSDRGPAVGAGVSGNRKFAGGGRTFRGSTRDVINPLQSMMQRAYNLSALTARNDVMGALYDLGEKAGLGSGAIIERVPASQLKAVNVDAAEALERVARDAGLSKRDVTTLLETVNTALEGETETTLFRAGEINERGEPIIYLWRGGEKIPLRLPDGKFGEDMFTALSGMNRQAKNLFVQIAAAPSRLLRLGITTQPEFFFANYFRDQLASWVLSDVGFKPFVSGARGIAEELAIGPTARLYNTVGGISGGANVASLDHARMNREIGALNQRGLKFRRFASFEGLIKASEVSETGTRLGLFKLAYKQALKRGMNEYDAAVEAAFTARDMLDFDRRGSNMVSAIRTITFLNASLQALDKARRVLTADGRGGTTLKDLVRPLYTRGHAPSATPAEKRQLALAAKAWTKIGALGVFGLALTAHYANDPEYQEISDYLRATHWMVKGPGGEWLAVPKPFELASLSNILERGYEATAKHDPTAWRRLVQGLGDVLIPPHEVTALAVPFQVAANRSSQGIPIVPDHLRYSVAPELQFNSYTSQLSRHIGKAVGVSPAVIDYLITGFGGSWGRTFLSATDTALGGRQAYNAADPADMFVARRFLRDVTRSSVSSKQFWDLTSQSGGQFTQDVGTFRALMNDGNQAGARTYLAKLSPAERAFVVVSVFGSGGDKKLEPIERASSSVRIISDLRRDIASGPIRGPQGSEIVLSPTERTKADEALSYLSMSEMRNSLIASGIEGWRQKDPIPRTDSLQRLYAASAPLVAALNMRMQVAGVVPPDQAGAVEQAWVQNRDRIAAAANSPALPALMVAKEFKGRAGAMRALRTAPSAMPQVPQVRGGAR